MGWGNRRDFVTAACISGASVGLAGCFTYEPDDDDDQPTTDAEKPENNQSSTDDRSDGESQSDDDGFDEPPWELLEDFEDLDSWEQLDSNGTFGAETADVTTGSQALRLRAATDDPYVGVTRTYAEPLDLTDKSLSLAFKAITPATYQLEIRLRAPNRNNTVYLNRTHHGPTDHWMRMDIGAYKETGNPDLSAVTEVQIIGRTRADDAAIEYLVDDIRTVDAPDHGRVILTFDDGHESQYTAFQMMSEYGFPGVDGVIPHVVGNDDRLDVEQLTEMRDAGWDIVSHPHPPGRMGLPLSSFDEPQQRTLIGDAIEWLETNGFADGAAHNLAPNHTRDATNLELLREYHESSASFGGGNMSVPATDPHTIGRIEGYDPDVVKRYIDLAAKYKQVCIPLWHIVGTQYDEYEVTENEFAGILEHIDNSDVRVITQSELIDNAVTTAANAEFRSRLPSSR